ncbi:MAG: hypothetical protein PHP46_00695 [Candidatus Omnitrophica bacterium]|nr:hypothetical protein [Candidatus Omnitrophota bacterium]
MRPTAHIITSGIIGVWVGLYLKSMGYGLISFLSGIIIDIDHIFDYYRSRGFTHELGKIYHACVKMDLKYAYLLLHSYEFLLLLWTAIILFSLGNFWKAMAIGVTQHIIFDQVTNSINTFGYFLTFRMIKGFESDKILKKDDLCDSGKQST